MIVVLNVRVVPVSETIPANVASVKVPHVFYWISIKL